MKAFEKQLDIVWNLLSRPTVLAVLAGGILLGFFLQATAADPDLFARLAVGRLIHLDGHVAVHDPFAFTLKHDLWVDHEWLAGLIFYALLYHFGVSSLFIAKIVLVLISLFWLARAASVESESARIHPVIFLLTAFSCLYLWSSTIRSQVFTFLFLPYMLFAFAAVEKRERWYTLLLIPFLMPIWSNAHGGFVVGLGLFGLYVVSLFYQKHSQRYPALMVFLITCGTSCVSPYGAVTYWTYILHAVTMERSGIVEWHFLNPISYAAVIPNCYVLLIAYGWYRYPKTRSITGLLLIVASLLYGYKHRRLIGIFFMVATVYAMPLMLAIAKEFPKREMMRRSIVICLPLLLILHVFMAAKDVHENLITTETYPDELTEWLWQKGNGGKLLVDFNRGSYALWRLYPKYKISIDGRYEEVYPDSTVVRVSEALTPDAKDFAQALEDLAPDYILIASVQPAFWQSYEDKGFCFVGKTEKFTLLARVEFEQCDDFKPGSFQSIDVFTPHF